MKMRIVLAATTALCAGIGMAHADSNDAWLTQSGTDVEGTINQSGSDGSASLGQSGSGDSATINQSGTGNTAGTEAAPLVQQGSSGGQGNDLLVNQGGDLNSIAGYQNGNRNTLRIDQAGTNSATSATSNNSLVYQQSGNDNGNITAGPSSGANNLSPYGPVSYSSPTGMWNYLNQSGERNAITLTESGSPSGYGNGVIGYQSGKDGIMGLSQSGGNNFAYIDQSGNKDTFRANQTNTNPGGDFNLMDIRQSANLAYITDDSRTGNALQYGYGLDLYVNQTGRYTDAYTTQVGADNFMYIRQNGTGSGGSNEQTTDATQNGSLLQLWVEQYGHPTTSSPNDVVSNQSGIGSQANIFQSGMRNAVNNTQSGLYQTALIRQNGGDLSANSMQSGSYNTALVDQIGSHNSYTGIQAGTGGSATVYQGATGNTAMVMQTAGSSGNVASINQNR